MAVNIYFLRLTAILQSLSIIQAKDKALTLTLTVQFSEPYPREQKSVNFFYIFIYIIYYIYKNINFYPYPFYPAENWTVSVSVSEYNLFSYRKATI